MYYLFVGGPAHGQWINREGPRAYYSTIGHPVNWYALRPLPQDPTPVHIGLSTWDTGRRA